jgi:3-deoxy-manno-octulosonate cytidylyltransferase (CMP-KDO synthetase)
MRIRDKDILIVIPARYKSSRFPGKPLKRINGVEMIKRTYQRSLLSGHPKNNIMVATDSSKILNFCKKNLIKSILTSKKCKTGTDRVAEVAKKTNYQIYINLQGDEPIFNPIDIKKVINLTKKYPKEIINGYCEIKEKKLFKNKNIPKVIFSRKKNLIYMSRQPIPSNALFDKNKSYRQICIYAFPKSSLIKYKRLNKLPFEKSEDIEILRFIEMEMSVKMVKLSSKSISVDTPGDIKKVEKILNKKNVKKIK